MSAIFTVGDPVTLPEGGQWTMRLVQGDRITKSVILLSNPEHPAMIVYKNKEGRLVTRELMPADSDVVLPS